LLLKSSLEHFAAVDPVARGCSTISPAPRSLSTEKHESGVPQRRLKSTDRPAPLNKVHARNPHADNGKLTTSFARHTPRAAAERHGSSGAEE
jgi:hypothetical protein